MAGLSSGQSANTGSRYKAGLKPILSIIFKIKPPELLSRRTKKPYKILLFNWFRGVFL